MNLERDWHCLLYTSIIFDEPTAALTIEETEKLYKIIRQLKERGMAIILISHRMEDLYAVGDRVVVLKDGENSGELQVAGSKVDDIVQLMIGRQMTQQFPKKTNSPGEKLLEVKGLTNSKITNISFELKKGEMCIRDRSDFERSELAKEKTGVEIDGIRAVNPVNGKEIPIWVSDYVLMSYGTGAIMAVPAHDTRDWEFAKKFNLPIIEVVAGGEDVQKEAFTDVATGKLINSGFLDGLEVAQAKKTIIEWLEEKKLGTGKTNFKLRDWVFSRQRYWGEPIPIVHCDKCGYVALPESELPLELPDVESYMPTDNGESPLAAMTDWVNTTCPCCGGPAKRETDTMPQWAGSSWYFLRYTDPHNTKALASPEALKYWLPVDWYNGGMELSLIHI